MTALTPKHSNSTTARDRKERKKLQNRLNQRAYRLRNQEKEGIGVKRPRRSRQYQVVCWRLDEERAALSAHDLSDFGGGEPRENARSTSPDEPSETTWFPLPLDQQLLHLIQYNVFRGLFKNKTVVQRLTMQYRINSGNQTEPFPDNSRYPSYSVILPVTLTSLPESLAPTTSQMNIVHSSWINALPFPKMRENLIKFEFDFDHAELIKDLVGNLINSNIFLSIRSSFQWRPAALEGNTALQLQEGYDNNGQATTASQSGLIVWGEPYRAESWEATPEFLRKWAWALEGCQELIDSTNFWRRTRGESPLRL
ncbi:bZIP transcription factor [Aspergillus undulatus]|uniref:bZIP transcription factor n=1 Tax=Aspergillus undulatus TaxID=1810928 RepID=UPI003CCD9D68